MPLASWTSTKAGESPARGTYRKEMTRATHVGFLLQKCSCSMTPSESKAGLAIRRQVVDRGHLGRPGVDEQLKRVHAPISGRYVERQRAVARLWRCNR